MIHVWYISLKTFLGYLLNSYVWRFRKKYIWLYYNFLKPVLNVKLTDSYIESGPGVGLPSSGEIWKIWKSMKE